MTQTNRQRNSLRMVCSPQWPSVMAKAADAEVDLVADDHGQAGAGVT